MEPRLEEYHRWHCDDRLLLCADPVSWAWSHDQWIFGFTDTNMAAPLLARSISPWLFAVISAIAFTTVLGTVSGLILASSGAVTADLLSGVLGVKLTSDQQVRVAKIAAVVVGLIAIVLGILFKELNVGYLVGWAFSIAASANLPALVMLLFWKGTTRQGIIASVIVGMFSSLGWILLSSDTYKSVYGLDPENAIAPFSQWRALSRFPWLSHINHCLKAIKVQVIPLPVGSGVQVPQCTGSQCTQGA